MQWDVFACEFVVAPLQGEGVIPDDTRNIDLVVKRAIHLVVAIQAVFVCFPHFDQIGHQAIPLFAIT
jgi:hypothetical protein